VYVNVIKPIFVSEIKDCRLLGKAKYTSTIRFQTLWTTEHWIRREKSVMPLLALLRFPAHSARENKIRHTLMMIPWKSKHVGMSMRYCDINFFFFFFFFFFFGLWSLCFNQCLLQNHCPYGSVFCFLPPCLDTHLFQIILNTAQPP
jgi:hypothetical protein